MTSIPLTSAYLFLNKTGQSSHDWRKLIFFSPFFFLGEATSLKWKIEWFESDFFFRGNLNLSVDYWELMKKKIHENIDFTIEGKQKRLLYFFFLTIIL